jgi:hypothetical protein
MFWHPWVHDAEARAEWLLHLSPLNAPVPTSPYRLPKAKGAVGSISFCTIALVFWGSFGTDEGDISYLYP